MWPIWLLFWGRFDLGSIWLGSIWLRTIWPGADLTGNRENHRPGTSHWQTWSHNVLHLSLRLELTTSVVIGTDCIGSYKSYYHTITATTAPMLITSIASAWYILCSLWCIEFRGFVVATKTMKIVTQRIEMKSHYGNVYLFNLLGDWVYMCIMVCLMVYNAIFNNISVISWRSVLLPEETGENHRPVASHWQTLSYNVVLSTPRHERRSHSQL